MVRSSGKPRGRSFTGSPGSGQHDIAWGHHATLAGWLGRGRTSWACWSRTWTRSSHSACGHIAAFGAVDAWVVCPFDGACAGVGEVASAPAVYSSPGVGAWSSVQAGHSALRGMSGRRRPESAFGEADPGDGDGFELAVFGCHAEVVEAVVHAWQRGEAGGVGAGLPGFVDELGGAHGDGWDLVAEGDDGGEDVAVDEGDGVGWGAAAGVGVVAGECGVEVWGEGGELGAGVGHWGHVCHASAAWPLGSRLSVGRVCRLGVARVGVGRWWAASRVLAGRRGPGGR